MPDHLIFTLTASLAAMGGPAGHERRGTDLWPGRSAIIGLLAAALGIRRDGDFTRLDALEIAVAVFDQGEALGDFHTAQTIPAAASKHPQTRAQALREAGPKSNTVLSYREYRSSTLYGVAVSGEGLEDLRDALLKPVFTLYLGRKSCPLSSPLSPRIVQADQVDDAFSELVLPSWQDEARANLVITDDTGGNEGRTMVRHDVATDRTAWNFSPRRERIRAVNIAPGKSV